MGDSDGCIHPERAAERVPGRYVRYVRLGDKRTIEEDTHGTREQVVITCILDGALENSGHVNPMPMRGVH